MPYGRKRKGVNKMTGYNDSTAYAFDLFETHERTSAARAVSANEKNVRAAKQPRTASAAAPKRAASPAKKTAEIKKVAPKSRKQVRVESKQNARRATAAAVFLAIVFCALSLQISALTRQYELFREINAAEQKIENAKSESIRLNSELNGITSIGVVDNYATKILGMTKAEKYQVKCVDLSEGDKVLFSSRSQVLSALSLKGDTDKSTDGGK